MRHIVTAAPATSDTIDSPESEILYLDPDVAALIAEVDAILCAALPYPSAAGATSHRLRRHRAPVGWQVERCTGPPAERTSAAVRAVQRGPPNREQPASKSSIDVKGR